MTRVRFAAQKQKVKFRGGGTPSKDAKHARSPTSGAGDGASRQPAQSAIRLWQPGEGESAVDALPDSVLQRVFLLAARRTWPAQQPCSSLLLPEEGAEADQRDVQPQLLVRLGHVSRRWRRLALADALWSSVAFGEGTASAVAAGAADLPVASRAVRSVHIKSYAGGLDGLQRMHAAFHERLESLDLFFDPPAPLDALAGFQHFTALRSLYLGTDEEDPAERHAQFSSPPVQAALSALSRLSALRALELAAFPLYPSFLAALQPLAPSLTALDVPLYHDSGEYLSRIASPLCSFTRLQRLRVVFHNDHTGHCVVPPGPSSEFLPLASALPDLRALSLGVALDSFELVPALPRIEVLSLCSGRGEDFSPLAAAAATLRSFSLRQVDVLTPSAAFQAAADALPLLPNLEAVELQLASSALRLLASRPFSLPRLREATVSCLPREEPVPGPFLRRLSEAAPGLRALTLESAPPLLEDLHALSLLNDAGLRVLSVGYEAGEGLRKAGRRVLRAALPDVEVAFEEAALVDVL